jgi:hypothetical protein
VTCSWQLAQGGPGLHTLVTCVLKVIGVILGVGIIKGAMRVGTCLITVAQTELLFINMVKKGVGMFFGDCGAGQP